MHRVVEGVQSGSQQPEPGRGKLVCPSSSPRPAGQLIVPSSEQFALIRSEAKAAGTLKNLQRMVAAWQVVAEKCDLAFEEVLRLAVFRLEVERDLGAQLAQAVKVGRPRKLSSRSTVSGSNLSSGLTRNQSASYQKLAAIPDEVFRAYIEKARVAGTPPSSAGARRFASPRAPRKSKAKEVSPPQVPASVLDAVSRIMTLDVVVGRAKIEAKSHVSATAPKLFEGLTGDVLVAECLDPAKWLPKLTDLRLKAQVNQVVVVVRAEVWSNWFSNLRTQGWVCCFLRGLHDRSGGLAVLHHGVKRSAFHLTMGQVGVVME